MLRRLLKAATKRRSPRNDSSQRGAVKTPTLAMAATGGLSPAILSAKSRDVKDLLPGEVLDQAFLYLSRVDVEAVQISCRYFRDIISAEGFGKLTPLRLLEMVQLLDGSLAIWMHGKAKRFGFALIDSEDVLRWLRNTCVKSMCLVNTTFLMPAQLRTEPGQAERALCWFVAHRSMLRVISIHAKLPLDNDELTHAFLRPDPSHRWTLASISSDVSVNLQLKSSSLENVEHLSFENGVVTSLVQVTVGDVVRWLHRPVSPFVKCRELHLSFENIDGEPQRLLEAVREEFMAATTSREFLVMIDRVPDVFTQAYVQADFRKYNRDTRDLLHIEIKTHVGDPAHRNQIVIRRRPFP